MKPKASAEHISKKKLNVAPANSFAFISLLCPLGVLTVCTSQIKKLGEAKDKDPNSASVK